MDDLLVAQVSYQNKTKVRKYNISSAGDCGAQANGFGMPCNGIGGQPPATLAEFTLNGWGGSDYYDLSNVDGHTIGMSIRPIPGQYTPVNNPSLGKYNCGAVSLLERVEISLRQDRCCHGIKPSYLGHMYF